MPDWDANVVESDAPSPTDPLSKAHLPGGSFKGGSGFTGSFKKKASMMFPNSDEQWTTEALGACRDELANGGGGAFKEKKGERCTGELSTYSKRRATVSGETSCPPFLKRRGTISAGALTSAANLLSREQSGKAASLHAGPAGDVIAKNNLGSQFGQLIPRSQTSL